MATIHTLSRAGRRYHINELGSTTPGNFIPAGTGDPYFSNVSCLLHFDTNYADSGPLGLTFNATGAASINSTTKKYGAGSLDLTSGGSVATANNVAFRFPGDFTVECWCNTGGPVSGYPFFCEQETGGGGTSAGWWFGTSANNRLFFEGSSGGNVVIDLEATSGDIADNNWHHVVVCRSGTSIQLFRDGTSVGSGTNGSTFSDTGQPFTIGFRTWNSGNQYTGYIDDLRITKGVARYTSNFTPPTGPFPNS